MKPGLLRSSTAAFAAVLAFAGIAAAAPPNRDSGKGDAPHAVPTKAGSQQLHKAKNTRHRVPERASLHLRPRGVPAEQRRPGRLRQLRPREPARRRAQRSLRRHPRHRGRLRRDDRDLPEPAQLRQRALRHALVRRRGRADGRHEERRVAGRQLVDQLALRRHRERGLRARRVLLHRTSSTTRSRG